MVSCYVMKIDIVKHHNLWFVISGILIAAGLFFVVQSVGTFKSPIRPGLDFTGGTKLEYKFFKKDLDQHEEKLDSEHLQAILSEIGLEGSGIQVSQDADPTLIIRTKALSEGEGVIEEKLNTKLREEYGNFEVLSIDTVSPIIGPELFKSGLIALLVTILGIIIYISSRFKKDYAACAIAALCHDVFIVVGLFAYLGLYHGVEVNSLFITALLTVFGFSVHDTIVVFDRIRENQKLQTRSFGFEEVANLSVSQVAVRSINTSITTLTVLGFLFFFGGASTKLFVGAMFVGMLAGTYSSLFIASPLLVILRKNKILS